MFLNRISRLYNKKLLVVCLFVAIVSIFVTSKALSLENSWVNGDMPQIKIGQEIVGSNGYLTPGNRTCYNKIIQTPVYKEWDSSYITETPVQSCVVKNQLGSFGGTYLSPNTYFSFMTYYPTGANPAYVEGVPNQPIFFLHQASPQRYGVNLSLYRDIRSDGTFGEMRNNIYSGLIYRFNEVKPPLEDSSGEPLNIFEYAFSENGQWMVIEADGIGLIRMNLLNGEMSLFSTETHPRGEGYSVYVYLAISNDGNYAIKSGLNAGGTILYDLSGCSNNSYFDVFVRPTTGCLSRDISNFLRENLSGAETAGTYFLQSMRFSSDGRSISGVSLAIPESGKKTTRQTMLSLDPIPDMPQTSYLAMGDSFASGEGDMDDNYYEPGTNIADVNMCHLSRRSYPYLIAKDLLIEEFHSVACSGAKEIHIAGKGAAGVQYNKDPPITAWSPGYKNQLSYISDTPPSSFITVSIGGNDLQLISILRQCVIPKIGNNTCDPAKDQNIRGELAVRIAGQFQKLKDLYEQLANETKHQTKIYVVGYPQIINPDTYASCGLNVQLNDQERQLAYRVVHYTDRVIKAAAEAAGVYYVDVEDALRNQGLCSDVSDSKMAVNGITVGNDININPWYKKIANHTIIPELNVLGNESFHPNQNGHKLLEQSILEKTLGDPAGFNVCADSSERICPKDTLVPTPDAEFFGESASSAIECLNSSICQESIPTPKDMVQADQTEHLSINILVDGLKSNSSVDIEIHSDPTSLGTFPTDSEGKIEANVTIPSSVSPGYHEIHVKGQDVSGQPIDYYQTVFITGSEGDVNSDGVADTEEFCGFVKDSGVDHDHDGIDDACDGQISDPAAGIISSVDDQNQDASLTQPTSGSGPQSQATALPQSGLSTQTQVGPQSILLGSSTGFNTAALLNQTQVPGNTSSQNSHDQSPKTDNKGHVPIFVISVTLVIMIIIAILFRMIDSNRDKS